MNHTQDYFTQNGSCIPKGGVRTRFAPSPTGYMHVGNLRTALFAYLIAKNAGGKFLLRIEDTDQARYIQGATEVIYRTLKECGLKHDEGPDLGGPAGPYIQTERKEIYAACAELLIRLGGAYRCFCDDKRLEELHAGTPGGKYDGKCADLSSEESDEKARAGVPFVIRQKIPREGSTTVSDLVFGRITVENSTLDDNVLIKTDGLPTYNFANVVDDHLMGITHVVRGSEYLSSAPKYDLLYRAFGWEIPQYIHCPPVMRDAQHKLSKRRGDPTYDDLIREGYLPEAVVNYVALLGWSPGGETELFSLGELEKIFSVAGISKSPAIFDREKLDHFNAEYLRALPQERFNALAEPYIRQGVKNPEIQTALIAQLLQSRCVKLTDIPPQVDFFDEIADYDPELYVNKKSRTDRDVSLDMLRRAEHALAGLAGWDREMIHEALMNLAVSLGVKNGTLLWPVRIAVSGKQTTPGGGVEICHILGREESLKRIRKGIKLLEETR